MPEFTWLAVYESPGCPQCGARVEHIVIRSADFASPYVVYPMDDFELKPCGHRVQGFRYYPASRVVDEWTDGLP